MTVNFDYQYYMRLGQKDIELTVHVKGYHPDKLPGDCDVKLSFIDLDGRRLFLPRQFYKVVRFNEKSFDDILIEYGDAHFYNIQEALDGR